MSVSLSNTTPAAPAGKTNIAWQADGQGNVSGNVPTESPTYTVVSKTTTYTASNGEDVWCTGTFTVTLPPVGATTRVKVTNRSTGAITISPQSGTINGLASKILGTQYGSVELASDGTNWGVE